MIRRKLLTITLLASLLSLSANAAPVQLSAQDQADLSRIEIYLNTLHTFRARFLQVGPDGNVTGGNAWLSRPGRMRFEYDKPAPFLMVAGFGSFVFYDSELNQTTSIPLAATPLSILLADRVVLGGDVTVTGVERQPGQIQVSMSRKSSPEDGSLTLVFADQPLALRQWVITDGQRQETRVSLFNVEQGGSFPASMFQFEDPRLKSNSNN
jgi:outer membrane lipoprotein-sorting protein